MEFAASRKTFQSIIFTCLMMVFMFNRNAVAVDETIPHPIIERGTISWIAIKAMKVFRDVEVVVIKDSSVQIQKITIKPGSVIVIENQDESNHRLTFSPADGNDLVYSVNSPVIDPGDLWGAEFLDAGIYPYHCTLHPEHVSGIIEVIDK